MYWKCPVCGKELDLELHDWKKYPRTILFGTFKYKRSDGIIVIKHKRPGMVCSEGCKQKHEEQYVVEEYHGHKIYCIEGNKYMPYLDCAYYYDTIEGCRHRIDNPNIIPVSMALVNGLNMALSGEPGNIM